MKIKFPSYIQTESKDCGPTCLKIISKFYGKTLSIDFLRTISETTREGSSLFYLSEAAEKIGFRTLGLKSNLDKLSDFPRPCILLWNNNHYVVLYDISKKEYKISDPSFGLISYTEDEFKLRWCDSNNEGKVLLLEPTPDFFNNDWDNEKKTLELKSLFHYIKPYKKLILQLIVGLFLSTLLQLIFPFLTQSIVDVGIKNNDLNFIVLILIAQLFIFFGRTTVEVIRSWILLHISARINIALVSDFFIKLMQLPISYFDTKLSGDLIQRIHDHKRIETLITNTSLSVIFSTLNLIVLSGVLLYFNPLVFTVFILGTILYFLWIIFFLKKREIIDYKKFTESSKEQSKIFELINGMQEIKLHNAEINKRWGWEKIQARLFKISIKGLIIEQIQSLGSSFINELKNIIIIVLSAKLVISGEITLGTMLAITSIVGSLNGPIIQLIEFIRELQDAKIALSRLSEIHQIKNEFSNENNFINAIESNQPLIIKNLTFKYKGANKKVLNKINFKIQPNSITAIVGESGSGKTTLLKILLKYYPIEKGEVLYGITNLKNINPAIWRDKIGVVMQEGFIFNDSIANNIALGENKVNLEKLFFASKTANCDKFIEDLPLNYNTIIGSEGIGLSTGQKQRILIARAIYKNPEIIIFDEATSALDANNEKDIMNNLNVVFKNKTVIIVAHRLSTVMNADQIIVLNKGEIAEIGNHDSLIKEKGIYYNLVKNQLQLAKD